MRCVQGNAGGKERNQLLTSPRWSAAISANFATMRDSSLRRLLSASRPACVDHGMAGGVVLQAV